MQYLNSTSSVVYISKPSEQWYHLQTSVHAIEAQYAIMATKHTYITDRELHEKNRSTNLLHKWGLSSTRDRQVPLHLRESFANLPLRNANVEHRARRLGRRGEWHRITFVTYVSKA